MTDITADIVNTMRQPVLILDRDLRVTLTNAAFLDTFKASKEETVGRRLRELGNGPWDIPELRRLLRHLLEEGDEEVTDFRVEHEFEQIGKRIMMFNAHPLRKSPGKHAILVSIEDRPKLREPSGSWKVRRNLQRTSSMPLARHC